MPLSSAGYISGATSSSSFLSDPLNRDPYVPGTGQSGLSPDPLVVQTLSSALTGSSNPVTGAISQPSDRISPTFSSGYFTVGSTGQVSIRYLFDGGGYEGELAIFNVDGIEQFGLGTPAFIQEIARRALSDSPLGHIVISDRVDAAFLNGELGESNYNSGVNAGIRTFSMQAGTRFGIMLVPNGTVDEVFKDPKLEGDRRPLFSLVTANPNAAFHVGQIADLNGQGSAFVMEDLRVDEGSDRDYNDMIFQVLGATGTAVNISNVIDSTKDWRGSDLGKRILDEAGKAALGRPLPGDALHPALPVPAIPQTSVDQGGNGISSLPVSATVQPNPGGALPNSPTLIEASATQDVIDQVSPIDPTDIYRVPSSQLRNPEISVLSGNLSVSFTSPSGQVLGSQVLTPGTHTLRLPSTLPPEVLIKIDSYAGSTGTYILKDFESKAAEPFNISLEFGSGLTASQQAIMQAAARSIEPLITQGLPSAIVDGKIIDDINFKISVANLDRRGGTAAQTKIDFMRYGTLLPAQALTQFDSADLAELERNGQLFSVMQHELLHGMGFGNLWEAKGLVDYVGTPLAQYNGANAVQAFKDLGGLTDSVPLETNGEGSAGLHWNETLFQDEVMTYDLGFKRNADGKLISPISPVTLASLADLGYQVNLSRAASDFGLFGGQRFNPGDLTPEQIEAFQQLAEAFTEDQSEDFIPAILPDVDPSKVAPEIWAHAERFWKSGEYYAWIPYAVQWGDTLSQIALDTMGSAHPDNYWWIANHNGIPNPDYIVASDGRRKEWIEIPIWHPNYEWEQEQERLRREDEFRRQQEAEAQRRREQEEQFRRDEERRRQEEEQRRREAEAHQRELEEQQRRLEEEQRRRRQQEEYEREQARLRELERQREIARQQGLGGLDWYIATPISFGSDDPFQIALGDVVGNLVPDDYYRFTLSRNGRLTAELKQLLADADLVLYDARNRPISYSMREGLTDEQIIADLIPGTYMLRVNSPKGVTTDYDLVVKFQHILSQTQKGPPPGWRVGGSNSSSSGSSGPIFSDPRIQNIYDTALNNLVAPERVATKNRTGQLEGEKLGYEQELQQLLDQMNVEQRAKIYAALDNVRDNANVWADSQADSAKRSVDHEVDWILERVDSKIPGEVYSIPGIGDALRNAKDSLKGAITGAGDWLNQKISRVQDRVKDAIWHFIEFVKNAYRTGGEINALIEQAAADMKRKIDSIVDGINDLIGEFKSKITGSLRPLRNVGAFGWNFYDGVVEPVANSISERVTGAVSATASLANGAVDWIKPRAQREVANAVDTIFGDKTGQLYNKIHGVDQQIENTRIDLEKFISNAVQHVLGVVRQIESLLTDPEERNRILDALSRSGYETVEGAYNFAREELPKVRAQVAEEVRQSFERAKKAFADAVRFTIDKLLGNSSKREVKSDLRLDKIIRGIADVRGGYKFELEKVVKEDATFYEVSTSPSIGLGLSKSMGSNEGGTVGWEVGKQSGNVKIALKDVQAEVDGRVEGDLVLGTVLKYAFNRDNDEDMARLGVWAFKEIPSPFDSIDPLLDLLVVQNYSSSEIFLEPSLTGSLVSSWGGGQLSFSPKFSGISETDGSLSGKVEIALDSEGYFRGKGAGLEITKTGINVTGKVSLTAKSKQGQLDSIQLQVDVPPIFVSQLGFLTGNSNLSEQIETFNREIKESGKAVENVSFKVTISDPIKLLASYGSVVQDAVEISQSKSISDFSGDVYETLGTILRAIRQTQNSVKSEVTAEATQSVYVNAEAGVYVVGGLGVKDTSTQTKRLY